VFAASERTDHTVENAAMTVIWSHGQRNSDTPGLSYFYRPDELKYHANNRGRLTVNFHGQSHHHTLILSSLQLTQPYRLFVCLSVCQSARITQKPHSRTLPIFCAYCLWPWLCPPMTALRYIMYIVLPVLRMTFPYHGAKGPK